MARRILFIDHSYHKKTKSSQFFIDYLKTHGDVTIQFDDCWKGGPVKKDYIFISKPFDLVVVWQLEKVASQLSKSKHKNIVFVPMYDSIHKKNEAFWRSLKCMKIVCFSRAVHAICLTHRLDAFHIQYYPANAKPAAIGYDRKKLFFWQRKNWPNWQTVTSILPVCQFEKIHLHQSMDPGIELNSNTGPTHLETQQANFESSQWFENKNDFFNKMMEYNLFFVPREKEGIGFSFLDAMAIGMIPIGFDHPTFNEYIVNGVNGFIVEKNQRMDIPALEKIARNMTSHLIKGRQIYEKKIKELDNYLWKQLVSKGFKKYVDMYFLGENLDVFIKNISNKKF